MITADQLAALIEATPKDEPLFASLDEMCEALGFDDETKAQMRRDSEWQWQTRRPQ